MTTAALEISPVVLRNNLLAELDGKSRTTVQLAALSGVTLDVAYRALLALQQKGKVTSFKDRRKGVSDSPPLVWSRPDAPRALDKARRDPLVAALFGSPP
jgi:hypothetical protein